MCIGDWHTPHKSSCKDIKKKDGQKKYLLLPRHIVWSGQFLLPYKRNYPFPTEYGQQKKVHPAITGWTLHIFPNYRPLLCPECEDPPYSQFPALLLISVTEPTRKPGKRCNLFALSFRLTNSCRCRSNRYVSYNTALSKTFIV